MMSEAAVRAAASAAGIDAPVRYDEVTGSTNAVALELAEAGAPEWTLVAAGHQTSGRGRLGRTWEDVAGRALLVSLVLRPGLDQPRLGLIPLLAGASAAAACREVADVPVACKWPNDLVLEAVDRDAATPAKVGGILVEGRGAGDRLRYLVLGVGINVGETPAGVPGAAAVPARPPALLEAFLRVLRARYVPGAPGFASMVLAAYRPLSVTLGRTVRASAAGGRIEGRAVDLDEAGGLIVEQADGVRRTVAFGEVEHVR
jgi:BirA family biotin operon repressor/biotin-[acetyl-CoA-carboxylase] ligase